MQSENTSTKDDMPMSEDQKGSGCLLNASGVVLRESMLYSPTPLRSGSVVVRNGKPLNICLPARVGRDALQGCLEASLSEIKSLQEALRSTTVLMEKRGAEAKARIKAQRERSHAAINDAGTNVGGAAGAGPGELTTTCSSACWNNEGYTKQQIPPLASPEEFDTGVDDMQRAEHEQNLLNEISMRDAEITSLEDDVRRYRLEAEELTRRLMSGEAETHNLEQVEKLQAVLQENEKQLLAERSKNAGLRSQLQDGSDSRINDLETKLAEAQCCVATRDERIAGLVAALQDAEALREQQVAGLETQIQMLTRKLAGKDA